MLKKTMTGIALMGLLAVNAMAADVFVNIRPPRAVVEHRSAAPGRGYVWLPGYHNWNGKSYVWVPGRWEMPPRAHAHWVAPRWQSRNHGWVFVEGRWR